MPARGSTETVDCVIASIGNVAITQSDLEAEYRFELFLNGQAPEGSPDRHSLRRIAARLIEQKLLAEELRADAPDATDSQAKLSEMLAEVRKKFPTEQAFQSALRALDMTEQEVKERLAHQQRLLQRIDQRLRPAAWPEQSEIETYYRETFLPEYAKRGSDPPPPLQQFENGIREILVQKKIDQLLTAWLEELKSSHRARFHSF